MLERRLGFTRRIIAANTSTAMHIGGEMRKTTIRILLLFTACFAAMHATAQRDLPELNTNPGTLSLVEFQRLFEASKRWGEFGDDD